MWWCSGFFCCASCSRGHGGLPRGAQHLEPRLTNERTKPMTVIIRADEAIQALAKEAISIQDACNGCGLAQRFAEVMLELVRHPQSLGTGWVNQHPVTKFWI